jgi:hypothetical protein
MGSAGIHRELCVVSRQIIMSELNVKTVVNNVQR